MKLKSLTKLALSGVALAAVAATLGTSTYAWYVANSTATVEGLSGTTAASNSGNLLLAQLSNTDGLLKETGNWGNKLTSVTVKSNATLNPVAKDTDTYKPANKDKDGNAVTLTGWHDRDLGVVATTAAYNFYAFGIMSSQKTKVNMTFGISNTTAKNSFKPQTCYSEEGTGSIGVNNDFYVDLVSALRVEVFQAALPDDPTTGIQMSAVGADTNSKGLFNTTNFKNGTLNGAYDGVDNAPTATQLTNGNAHEYYADVAGENPAAGVTEVAGTAATNGVTQLTVTAGTKYVLLFRVWIEGTDTDCFDSIGGQSYQINLGFEAVD